jgi:hypothetical protein
MKHEDTIEISFAGDLTPNEVENVTPMQVEKEEKPEKEVENASKVHVEADVEQTYENKEETDSYAVAVEALFGGYQAFQEGMQSLTRTPNPKLLMGKLIPVLEGFQAEIAQFKEAEFDVPEAFIEGHNFLLEAIKQYDVFLVDYPSVLSGKGGLKALKKVAKLGKLSASADQDMKKAFRSFDEATQGV